MAAQAARCMQDPNVRDPRDDATQVELADKWWEALKVAKQEMSLAQICISERPQRAFGSIRRMAWGTRLKEKRPVRKLLVKSN